MPRLSNQLTRAVSFTRRFIRAKENEMGNHLYPFADKLFGKLASSESHQKGPVFTSDEDCCPYRHLGASGEDDY